MTVPSFADPTNPTESLPTGPAVPVAVEVPGVSLIANVDALSVGNVCSCAAGDDNPF
ncbi:hypothetical protein [Actinomadura sp. NEAU-AAG7]|uniref:hypothetical protein n=1 Tax=Actinomadura sp. NEAU-AAG7 TaxID=2839640 RepID=UPI001BE3EA3A|nr:hypothetical protein [Actinomadura sp. NEAU-AAG7]MBT2211542.1 hypothetical protein [Actinomadura sp. NEAU-AAG7]